MRDLIRTSISEGLLRPSDRLVEEDLIGELSTSRNLVRDALQMLAHEGVIRREPRLGTFVVGGRVPIDVDGIQSQFGPNHVTQRRIARQRVPSNQVIRSRLQSDAAEVDMSEYVFMLGNEPIGVRVCYYTSLVVVPNWTHCPDLAAAVRYAYERDLGRVQSRIDSVPFDERTGRMLQVGENNSALTREQVLYDSDDVPLELAYSSYRADRVTFTSQDRVERAPGSLER